VKYAFIQAQSGSYPREMLCCALEVSTSGYADWQRGSRRKKHLTDLQLITLIEAIDKEVKGAYGSPRMTAELKDRGYAVGKTRVENMMRKHGIKARHKRKYRVTTDSRHHFPVAPNRLNRQFQPDAPNKAWSADITFIPTDEGWLYLAVVLDLYDRSVVGWSMKEHMKTDLVLDALTMAWFRRKPTGNVLHHSDRGSQYASHAFQEQLKKYGMTCPMSRKGNCWDNAPTESFFNSLKNERVHANRYATRDEAKADVFEYIELFYNRRRRHSALKGKSPAAVYEQWLYSQQYQAA